MTLVSICMPTYEPKPHHLKAAIDSVLAQTHKDWTLLIHDDASKTNVEEVVKPYLRDSRITFKRSPTRLGIGGNWNACIGQVKAPFFQFLFQDDWWNPTYLELTVKEMEKGSDVSFVAAHHTYVFEGDPAFIEQTKKKYAEWAKALDSVVPGTHDTIETLHRWLAQGLHPNIIGEPCFVLMRRANMEKVGPYDETQTQCIDMDYWIRLMLLPGTFVKVGEDTGNFRVHAEGTSARNSRQNKGLIDRLRIFDKLLALRRAGPWKQEVRRSLVTQIELMGRKFRERKAETGSGVGGKPPLKALLPFVVRHPVLVARGVIRSFF